MCRPMEVDLGRFNAWSTRSSDCTTSAGTVSLPADNVNVTGFQGVEFDEDDNINNDFFETEPYRSGRPLNYHAPLSRRGRPLARGWKSRGL